MRWSPYISARGARINARLMQSAADALALIRLHQRAPPRDWNPFPGRASAPSAPMRPFIAQLSLQALKARFPTPLREAWGTRAFLIARSRGIDVFNVSIGYVHCKANGTRSVGLAPGATFAHSLGGRTRFARLCHPSLRSHSSRV